MAFAGWVVVFLSGVLAGAAVCAALVVPRRLMWTAAAAAVVGLGALVIGLATIWAAPGSRADTIVASSFIALGAWGGGLALAAALLPSVTRPAVPAITVEAGPDDGRVHVVVLADAEPETYSPGTVTGVLQDLADSGVPLPPDAARVLVYVSERARYRSLGHSPARPAVRALTLATSVLLEGGGVPGQASAAYCSGESQLAEVLAAEVKDGARRVVVAIASVAETRALDRARRTADALRLDDIGVSVSFTAPLWPETGVTAMMARRTAEAFEGGPREDDGVVLVSEGEPPQWLRDFPLTAEQNTFFSQRLRSELVEAGFTAEFVRTAWLEWDEPDVTEVLRHLAALGCRRIAIVPATIMFDTIETVIDLRIAADRVAVETSVGVAVLSAWGDDEAVAQALSGQVLTVISEFDDAAK